MMKRAILFLLLLSMPLLSRGSIPKPQPLAEAFADFQKAYPSRSEELIAVIRDRIAEKKAQAAFRKALAKHGVAIVPVGARTLALVAAEDVAK